MIEVVRYSSEHKAVWDAFVESSKNGTFLFRRDYMEYHADRFTDHSLLFYRKGKLLALFPANEQGKEVHSHAGLTYGGIVSNSLMKTAKMLGVFSVLVAYYREKGFQKVFYKAVPHIYHNAPAEEDLYALFRYEATLYRRDVNSALALQHRLPYATLRKRKLKGAAQEGLHIRLCTCWVEFMQLSSMLLKEKYGVLPVHTAEEMLYLAELFPENIKLYCAYEQEEMLAGIIIYETATVAHCQYIGATARGRAAAALDFILDHLISQVYANKKYFDFGISTEQQGWLLNEGLIWNKESFGARAIMHDFYMLQL